MATAKPPTMRAVRDTTHEQLTAMTPPQVDWLNAALDEEKGRRHQHRDQAYLGIYRALGTEKILQGRSRVWPMSPWDAETQARAVVAEPPAELDSRLTRFDFGLTVEKYTARISEALAALDAATAAIEELRPHSDKLEGEWERRDGWPRFFRVPDGHIHQGSQCHTIRLTTQLTWQPDLSGLTEADAVAKLGPFLCTHCFKSAPTEWKLNPADQKNPDQCDGSRQDATPYMDARMKRLHSKYADCPVCGAEGVSITSNWRFRAHKPKPETA